MKFLRKMFSGRQMGDQQEDQQSDEQSGEPEEGGPPQVQGVLILTRQHLNDSWDCWNRLPPCNDPKGTALPSI